MKYVLNDTWVNDATISKLPLGATALTEAEWLARQSTPFIPPWAPLKAAEFASFRAQREEFLDRMTGVQSEFVAMKTPAGDAASTNVLLIRQRLLAMLTDPAIVAASEIVQLKTAMKAAYKAITNATTAIPAGLALPEVVAAYRKVDQ